jgi:hypothetical protein
MFRGALALRVNIGTRSASAMLRRHLRTLEPAVTESAPSMKPLMAEMEPCAAASTLGESKETRAAMTPGLPPFPLPELTSVEPELKSRNYFDRIHAASGGLNVTKTVTEENARALIAHAMRTQAQVTPTELDLDAQVREVVQRIYNDFKLRGSLRTSRASEGPTNRSAAPRRVVRPAKGTSVDEAFDTYVQF